MPTKWTNQLSPAQHDLLLIVAGRPRFVLTHDRCEKGIVSPYVSEGRTVKALVDRGLVRWVWANKDPVPNNGITLTEDGANTLVPPGKVTYPEQAADKSAQVPPTLRVNLPNRPSRVDTGLERQVAVTNRLESLRLEHGRKS